MFEFTMLVELLDVSIGLRMLLTREVLASHLMRAIYLRRPPDLYRGSVFSECFHGHVEN